MRKDPITRKEFLKAGFSELEADQYFSLIQYLYYDLIANTPAFAYGDMFFANSGPGFRPLIYDNAALMETTLKFYYRSKDKDVINSVNVMHFLDKYTRWPKLGAAMNDYLSWCFDKGIIESVEDELALLQQNLCPCSIVCLIGGIKRPASFDYVRWKIEQLIAGYDPLSKTALESNRLQFRYGHKNAFVETNSFMVLTNADRVILTKHENGENSFELKEISASELKRIIIAIDRKIKKAELELESLGEKSLNSFSEPEAIELATKICSIIDYITQLQEYEDTLDEVVSLDAGINADVLPLPDEGIPQWKYQDPVIGGPPLFDPKPQHCKTEGTDNRQWIPIFRGGLCIPK